MPRARLINPRAELRRKGSYNISSLQLRHSTGLFRRTSSASKKGLSPSYKLGTILGTIGGVGLLLLCLLYLWYIGRTRPKSVSESDITEPSGGPPWDQPPLPINQERPNDRGPQGGGRPIERGPDGDGRPIERVPMGGGEPMEIVHNRQGRPPELVQQGGGGPLELVHQGGGRHLERANQGEGRPLERAPRGGRVRRGGDRPLGRAPGEGGIRGGETILQHRGWTRPSRRKAAVGKTSPRHPVSSTKPG